MNPEDKEILRHTVLEILTDRHPVALPVAGIRRRAATQTPFPVTDEDVAAALEFLRGLGRAEFSFDSAGSTQWWKATSAGVLAVERGS